MTAQTRLLASAALGGLMVLGIPMPGRAQSAARSSAPPVADACRFRSRARSSASFRTTAARRSPARGVGARRDDDRSRSPTKTAASSSVRWRPGPISSARISPATSRRARRPFRSRERSATSSSIALQRARRRRLLAAGVGATDATSGRIQLRTHDAEAIRRREPTTITAKPPGACGTRVGAC